jgi:hypothetical protein
VADAEPGDYLEYRIEMWPVQVPSEIRVLKQGHSPCSVPGRRTFMASESAPAVLSTAGAPFTGYAGPWAGTLA